MKFSLFRFLGLVVGLFLIGALCSCPGQSVPTKLWTLQLPDGFVSSSPALAPNGTIYQATFSGKLVAVTPAGEIKWIFKTGSEIKSSPAIGKDGTIYFGSRDWKFYAVSPSGKLKWTFQTGAWVDSSPAIGTDGTIYFGSHDKKFYAVKPDGKLRWSYPTGGQIISSPAIAADGTIYFTSTDGYLYALRPDGSLRWRLHTGGATESSPVLDPDGNLYLAVNQDNVSVSRDGKLRWKLRYNCLLDASPAVAANSEIYFSKPWRELMAATEAGKPVWRINIDTNLSNGNMIASPAIGTDGTIYVAINGWLEAINSTNRLAALAKSSWPMFRANPRHTGRVGIEKAR